jgi:hypothetical protein
MRLVCRHPGGVQCFRRVQHGRGSGPPAESARASPRRGYSIPDASGFCDARACGFEDIGRAQKLWGKGTWSLRTASWGAASGQERRRVRRAVDKVEAVLVARQEVARIRRPDARAESEFRLFDAPWVCASERASQSVATVQVVPACDTGEFGRRQSSSRPARRADPRRGALSRWRASSGKSHAIPAGSASERVFRGRPPPAAEPHNAQVGTGLGSYKPGFRTLRGRSLGSRRDRDRHAFAGSSS